VINRRSEILCRLDIQGQKISKERKYLEAGSKSSPPKCRLTFYILVLYCIISTKIEFSTGSFCICKRQTPWPESASELFRPRDRRLSAKLVPTFADRGVSRIQRNGSLRLHSRLSRPEPLLFLPSSSSVVLARLGGSRSRPTTSQKSGSAGYQTRTSGPVVRNSDH
jgi:hypothetical protein